MFTLHRTRLFGVLAHVDAGKTTISERMLFVSGRIHRLGEVHHGNTTLDHDAEEKKHGITISAAASSFVWQPEGLEPHRLTLIDTPGHVDFAIEVERSLRVLDGAIVVLDASRGVEPQTESVWRQATHHRVPRVVFVNKLDAPGASIERCLNDLRERLDERPLPLQWLRADGVLVDLVERRELHFAPNGTMTTGPVALADPVNSGLAAAREHLVATLAELDDSVMNVWATNETPHAAHLHDAVRRATLGGLAVPVVFGAALKNRGVPALLDAVVRYLPSPGERAQSHGLSADAARPACGFVFKTDVDPNMGSLAWVRGLQGVFRPGDAVVVASVARRERVSRVLELHGSRMNAVDALGPGAIAVLVGLKSAKTGDTVAAPGLDVVLEPLSATEPMVELALSASTNEAHVKLGEALRRACLEDPSLRVRVDPETGQTVLRGVGELHLAIWLEKLARRDGLELKASAPSVSFRDTVAGSATVTYRHVRQTSGPGQFAVVTLRVTPLSRGAGVRFVNDVKGGSVAGEFVPAVERGARAALERGVREGVPVVDVEVTLLDGAMHSVDSSAMAFEIAGSLAVQRAVNEAGPQRLEPVAVAHLSVPEAQLGAALAEVMSRRGAVKNVRTEGRSAVVEAEVPLAKTFGMVTSLRSRTEGRGTLTLAHAGFQPVDA